MEYLKDVDIDFGSILIDDFSPSNKRKAIIKSNDPEGKERIIRVAKADVVKGELHLDLMISEFEDTQGQGYTDEEVEKAQARRLNKIIKSGKNTPSDINHNFKAEENVYLKQSFTFVEKDKSFYNDDQEHTVFREVYGIENNPILMEKAKNSAITGVSIAGRAIIDTEKSIVKSITEGFEKVINIFKKEPDMKKELEDFLKTDAGIAELKTLGFEKKETPAEPKVEEKATEPETPEAPETIEKSEFDVIKAELDIAKAETEELKKQLETIKTEFEDLKKAKQSDPTDTTTEKTLDDYIAEKKAKLMEKYQEKK